MIHANHRKNETNLQRAAIFFKYIFNINIWITNNSWLTLHMEVYGKVMVACPGQIREDAVCLQVCMSVWSEWNGVNKET